MNDALRLALALLAGGVLGLIFFGGLWWSVKRGMVSPRPVLWFLGSMLLRMAVTLSGFYLVADGQWQRLMICVLGFVLARFVVMQLTRSSPAALAQKSSHAA